MAGLYYPPTINGLQKQLGAQLDKGTVASATLNNTTNIQNKLGLFVVDRIDASGNEKSAAVREYIAFTGTSGNTVINLVRGLGGTTDQDHPVGAVVEFVSDVVQQQAILDTLANAFNPSTGALDTSKVTDLTTAQTLTNKTLTSPIVGTGINDTNGNELVKVAATTSAVNEVTLANAATNGNPVISATGGDDNVGIDIKAKGTGRFRKPTIVGIQVVDSGTNTTTGDGKAYFRVPAELNGMNLTGVAATVYTAGTTNTTDIQLRNKTDSVDMLSTKITIDSGETDTSTAATAAVIDTTKDDVVTGDVIAIDVDAVSTTPAKGLYVEMRFELP
jgi:hypothetical protein